MKAYKVEVLVIDFDGEGPDQIKNEIKNSKYIWPQVMSITEADIGDWSDDHPLNLNDTADAEYKRLFGATQ